MLSPLETSPSAVLASLRTLNTVAGSLLLELTRRDASPDGLIGLLYTDTHLRSLTQLLSQDSTSLVVQQQIALTATLITKTCQNEIQRAIIARSGVLEALASKLASFVVATGCSLTTSTAEHDNPHSAIARSRLAPILEAVGGIIQNSNLRADQFLNAPALAAVFPKVELDAKSQQRSAAMWASYNSTSVGACRWSANQMESLLPQLPNLHQRASPASASNYPPLGAIGTFGKYPPALHNNSPAHENPDMIDDNESPLVAWLIYIVRGEKGMTRLMAAWLLAILYRSGFANRRRETSFAFLLVPLLVRMLDRDLETAPGPFDRCDTSVLTTPDWALKEQAPAVLAMLAVDSNELQRAAVDAGAIKKLSQLLKESYDPLPPCSSTSLWAPDGNFVETMEPKGDESKLGAGGLSAASFHVTKLREVVLIALAALASLKDEYRKLIIDNGVVPFVIESLKPHSIIPMSSANASSTADQFSQDKKVMNPRHVILAACGTARGLSRSVSTLRTDLMDAGLAAPLFVLLRHSDIDVQVSATAVICNLVLEFSPMREVSLSLVVAQSLCRLIKSMQAILQADILKVLCEHAHSMIAELRLNSVWALKHLVLGAPNSLKIKCLEELGPGWLKQIISNDTDDFAILSGPRGDQDTDSRTPVTMGTPNAAGEQVDLLNAVENSSRESSQAFDDDGDEDFKMVDSIGALSRPHYEHISNLLLSDQHDSHVNEAGIIKRHDIEHQGLDLLRNILAGQGAADMIDYILREFGQDTLFELLANKLRPRFLNTFTRERKSVENGVRQVQPPTTIIIPVLYIIVHIAAGLPRHRQLLVSQSELLKLVVPLFTHTDPEVRCPCAWIVINASWHDNSADLPNSRSRARELVKLGFYEQLEAIETDQSLDVRERTRTALTQMATLLRS